MAVAQKIFSVDYASQADIKVFVVDYQNQADLGYFFKGRLLEATRKKS